MAPDAPSPRPGAPDERGRSATDLRLAAALVAGGSLLVLLIAALGARNSTARQAPSIPRAALVARDSALADPLDVRVNLEAGWGHYFANEHVRAINAFQRALRLDSLSAEGHDGMGRALVQMRRGAAGIARLRRAVDLGAGVRTQAHLAHALARFGYVEEARAIERTLVTRAASTAGAATPVDVAVIALGFGDVDRAFALLTEAEAARVSGLAAVTVEPVFTPLLDDPRFEMFLQRLNLAPPPPNEFKKGTPIPR